MKKFRHLNVPNHWEHYWTKYPEGYTILEALLNWVRQVDEMVDNVNEWNEYLDNFVETFDERLHPVVMEFMNDLLESGDLEALVKRSLFVFSDDEKLIYVDADSGNDNTGDGSEGLPYKSMTAAFNHLRSLSDIAADGQWTIRVSGTFTDGYRVDNLPKLRYPLQIIGDLSVTGEPATTFDGANAARTTALWFEHANGLNVMVYNIKFKNFVSMDIVGQALILRDGGFLHVENCHFTNVYQAISTVNSSRNTVHHCRFEQVATGVTTQYGGTLTCGSQSDREYRKNVFVDCRYGVRVTRNSVAHVDYNEFYNSEITAVSMDHNTRTNVTGNLFDGNNQAVTASGGAEWLNANNTYRDNDLDFQHYGVSRESRTHSVRTNVLFEQTPYVPPASKYILPVADRPETLFALSSVYGINPQQIADAGKRFTVKMVGRIFNPNGATGNITIRTVDAATGGDHDDFGFIEIKPTGMYLQNFTYELECIVIGKNEQITNNTLILSNGAPQYSRGAWNKVFTTDKIFRVVGNADAEGVEVDIRYVQTGIGG